MLSQSLNAIQRGFGILRRNTQLLFIALLLFVFPLLFIWVTQSFFDTAHNNINTREKSRVASIHESIATLLTTSSITNDELDQLLVIYQSSNADITKIRVIKESSEEFVVRNSSDTTIIGETEPAGATFQTLPGEAKNSPVIFPITLSDNRVWQVFRIVETEPEPLYIFTEHNFANIDELLTSRMQRSYFALSAIFVFLILVAYWISRQMNWEKRAFALETKLTERDLFSNMIAHELRAPLTAIRGYASFLLESKTVSGEDKRFTHNIQGASERLLNLVNDFLEVSRIQSGKLKLNFEETDIRKLLSQVAEDLQPMATEERLDLKQEDMPKPVMAKVDSDRFTQVLTNVISNAIKYTEKGSVSLEAKEIRGGVMVRIKDTGMGISAEDQRRLFKPFSRVGGVDDKPITGSGLGMWITKQLVELQNGTINIESIKGVGTHAVIKIMDDE